MDDLQDGYALGLDLGTTFSCIGVYRNGGVEIIPNRNGDKTTPSIVTIVDENTILKGEETYQHLVKDFDSSIYAIKRFIGRDYKDKKVKEEINFENFPFKIVGDKDGKFPIVAINKKNKVMKFTLEEISSFVIRKMVDSAEDFLGKKVNKLVITVPANFTDGQRKCTEKAAKLAGIEVLRIINEPTAAALAYGLGKTDNENGENKEKKILVFDLGGGTFDVTILSINPSGEKNFEILSTKGDKFLGGEDFDNKLVEHFLNNFCKNMGESKQKIMEDKKAIKRLKIACENIKKVLSTNKETRICVINFYKNNDILEDITRNQFEYFCSDLFEKLKKPLDDALLDAKLKKSDIGEIVLVGGSSRIPKVKQILQEYFNIDPLKKNNKNQAIINDSINPDETVAYGATLMAAKILIKNDYNLQGFNLMDITPLSLGINVKNNSNDPDIQKEGDLMSVIIKRGKKIPFSNTEEYQTSYDYQTEVRIAIYEGEKKFTKYNHVLGSVEMSGIPPKKAGEVKIDVKFFIDVNGILTVSAVEKANGQSIETKIINDTVGLTDQDIEELKKKNEKFYAKILENKTIDYKNLKDTLKEFQDSYNEAEDDEDKYNILMNYNNTLEEFIDKFNTDFDNETMVEKYYIYVKQLFKSYVNIVKIKSQITKEDQNKIFNNVQKYLKALYQHNSGYLNDLIEVSKDFPKKMFYEIIIIVIEELNNCGKKCLQERKKYCRYHSLMHFEKALSFFKKYIVNFKNISICKKDLIDKCKIQELESERYISDINSGAILLCEESLKSGKLINSNQTGFTNFIVGLKIDQKTINKQVQEIDNEKYQIVLSNYEKMFSELTGKTTKSEAICIANILKINLKFIGNTNYNRYYQLAERCEFIVDSLNLSKDEDWYLEFSKLREEIKSSYDQLQLYFKEMKERIKKKYKSEFDEIDNKFIDYKNKPKEFIKYILNKRPYDGYEQDKKNNKPDLSQSIEEIVKYLRPKYHPDNYSSGNDEKSELDYCLIEYIEAFLNNLYSEIQ